MFVCDGIGNMEAQTPPTSIHSSSSSTSSSSSSSSDFDTRRPLHRVRRKPATYENQCPQFPARKQYVALDCEMVGVGVNATRSSLARVVIVDWRGKKLFDEFIAQTEPVTDYRTFVSGITEQDLQNAKMSLHTCRFMVSKILLGKILVGHGLENDLRALGIESPPWWTIRDTACYHPFMVSRNNMLLPRKLKDLVLEKLGKHIQEIGKPHNPYEDARWAINLYKTVRSDWEGYVQYMIQRSVIENAISQGRFHGGFQMDCASRHPNFILQQSAY